jgi:hypothetical protein
METNTAATSRETRDRLTDAQIEAIANADAHTNNAGLPTYTEISAALKEARDALAAKALEAMAQKIPVDYLAADDGKGSMSPRVAKNGCRKGTTKRGGSFTKSTNMTCRYTVANSPMSETVRTFAKECPSRVDAAYQLGQEGAPPTEDERMLFEAWMRGHRWHIDGLWDGTTYVHPDETAGFCHPDAMHTRGLWAAWRDRAALGASRSAD